MNQTIHHLLTGQLASWETARNNYAALSGVRVKELNVNGTIGTIGAVFDFFAENIQRAPLWWQEHSLEWLYRLIKEPKRMWKRYIIGNTLFLGYLLKEKISN